MVFVLGGWKSCTIHLYINTMLLVWLTQGILKIILWYFRPFSIPFFEFIFVKLYPAIEAIHYCINVSTPFCLALQFFHHYFISSVKWTNLWLGVCICISEICCRNRQLLSIQISVHDGQVRSNKWVKINVRFFFNSKMCFVYCAWF